MTYTDTQGREIEDLEGASMRKPMLANEEDRRWSNTFLHVSLIPDPQMKLRSLRTFLCGELLEERRRLNAARRRRDEAVDAGEFRSWIAVEVEKVNARKAVIAELRRITKELRS